MDIRKFLKRTICPNESQISTSDDVDDNKIPSHSQSLPDVSTSKRSKPDNVFLNNDFGCIIDQRISNLTNEEKFTVLNSNFKVPQNYIFPKKAEGDLLRSFQHKWLDEFSPWLVYSPKYNGAFCKFCVIFHVSSAHNSKFGFLVTEPLIKWKKALEYFRRHEKTSYHQNCLQSAEELIKIYKNEKLDVVTQLNTALAEKIQENREKLTSILKILIFCGRQNLSLRGHEEKKQSEILINDSNINEGNFRALLNFRIDAGDIILKKHFETAAKNATYISPGIQNELIGIISEEISKKIVDEVSESPYYSILVDETTDIAGIEQMSLCVRYLKDEIVFEKFLKFTPVDNTSGENIANTIISVMEALKLDLTKLRGQGYDGASNMTGKIKGVKTRILQKFPLAQYTHCSSHALNLVIMSSCKNQQIQNMIGTVKTVTNFIRDSHIRRNCFKSNLPDNTNIKMIKSLCETRWVERHKVINEFVELFPTIIHTLQSLREKDNSSVVYLNSVLDFEFVVCLKIMKVFSSLLMPISIALQRPGCDLLEAFEEIKNLEKLVQNYRYDVDSYFNRIYKQILKIAEENDIEQSIPRICRRQQNRFNVQTENAQQYYKITVFIPFIDHLLSEISERFGPLFEKISFMQMFIPNTIKKYSCKEIEETVKKLKNQMLIKLCLCLK